MKLIDLQQGNWEKYSGSILSLGVSGEWDDLMTDCPSIFSDSQGKYQLFYTGHSSRSHSWAIGLAESKDFSNWKKFPGNPVLTSGDARAWDQRIDGPAVFKYQDKYYLFYEATPVVPFSQSQMSYKIPFFLRKALGGARRWWRSRQSLLLSQAVLHAQGRCIGFAESSDLYYWKKYSGNPVLRPSESDWDSRGVFSPFVFCKDDRFFLFYGGSDGLKISSGIAVSLDLANWQRNEKPILSPGSEGSWDDASVLVVSVLKLEDAYVAFYEGQNIRNEYAIGFAYSYDFIAWSKYENNPIIKKGSLGLVDERMVNSPHAFLKEESLYIFYGSQDFKMHGHSSMARMISGK